MNRGSRRSSLPSSAASHPIFWRPVLRKLRPFSTGGRHIFANSPTYRQNHLQCRIFSELSRKMIWSIISESWNSRLTASRIHRYAAALCWKLSLVLSRKCEAASNKTCTGRHKVWFYCGRKIWVVLEFHVGYLSDTHGIASLMSRYDGRGRSSSSRLSKVEDKYWTLNIWVGPVLNFFATGIMCRLMQAWLSVLG